MAIYVDYAATAPMRKEVIDRYVEVAEQVLGNASSTHRFGREARSVVDRARRTIAQTIHARPNEMIFTSGGTEADNLAILGVAHASTQKGHIVTTAIEHQAVLRAFEQLEREGWRVTYVAPDADGFISVDAIERALEEDTKFVSVMYGNNEVGTLQPIEAIGHLLKERDILFHTDAVQAYGVMPIDVNKMHVDLLSTSAHKIGGPKGVGFLYVRNGVVLSPTQLGGDQERKRRAGTENIPAIAAFSEAARLAHEEMEDNQKMYASFGRTMQNVWKERGIEYRVNGGEKETLPHIMNVSFEGIDIETFLVRLDLKGVAVSSGSACTAGSLDPSHVLVAMYGKDDERIRNSIRFSFGHLLTNELIEEVAHIVATEIELVKDE